jgi:hypothetical protein
MLKYLGIKGLSFYIWYNVAVILVIFFNTDICALKFPFD